MTNDHEGAGESPLAGRRPPGVQRWQREMTARVGAEVRKLRDARKWRAEQVVDKLHDVGVTITRPALANLESGRRDTISIGEWFGLAVVFDVPPAALLFPDPLAEVTVVPTRPPTPGYWALDWITGDRDRVPWDLLSEGTEDAERRYRHAAAALTACRAHDDLVLALMLADLRRMDDDSTAADDDRHTRAAIALAEHRAAMAAEGWTVPDTTDDDVARALAAVESVHGRRRRTPEPRPRDTATKEN